MQWRAAISNGEITHLSFHATGTTFAAAGNRSGLRDFAKHALEPELSPLRGEWRQNSAVDAAESALHV